MSETMAYTASGAASMTTATLSVVSHQRWFFGAIFSHLPGRTDALERAAQAGEQKL